MTRRQAIINLLCVAVFSGGMVYLAEQTVIYGLLAQKDGLKTQLRNALLEKEAALKKAAARESELEAVRHDSLELAKLREQMKSNTPAANLPTGFYIGTDEPVFVQYGTSNAVLRAFIKSLMDGSADTSSKGRMIFEKICAACHQPDGKGKDGIAPPLVGSEWVLAPGGERLARIVLNGLQGPIMVQGREWNLPMPPWRENLDDDAIAVVLNYIRSDLGANKAPAIKPDTVTDARQESHPGPETSAELLHISTK